MRLHEALHQILTHGGAGSMRLATYRSDSRPYFFFRKLVDAHVFDSCPAMGSAVRLMVEEGDAIILWNCGTGSSWRDRNGYLGALERRGSSFSAGSARILPDMSWTHSPLPAVRDTPRRHTAI